MWHVLIFFSINLVKVTMVDFETKLMNLLYVRTKGVTISLFPIIHVQTVYG
jgi:hypothetical protein